MLFADFGPISQQQQQQQAGNGTHSRSTSGSSLDELDLSTGSLHVGNTNAFVPGPSTERFERQMQRLQRTANVDDDEDWDIISKKIDSHVRLETQFFEYPTDQHASPPTSGNVDDDELTGTKVFLGGMRFEVVQVGRHMVSWLLEAACGVRIPVGRILIHRKSRNGKPAAPTGCASVYVLEDDDVGKLIGMNQKIFCGERGLHVASTPERMAQLIQSKSILDIVDGRVRGPTHPMIIERSYSSASTHSPVVLTTTPQNGSFSSASLTGSFSSKPAPPLLISDGSAPPVYYKYDGGEGKPQALVDCPPLQQPLELFVGGLCYEATRAFVSWLFSLIGITLHAQNVTLYVDPATGVKRGCAQVKIEDADFAKASSFTRRMLCDACGVYIADTPQGIVAVQQSKERSEHGARGPTHAVVIEKRRNTQRTQAPVHHQQPMGMNMPMVHAHHHHQFQVVSHHQAHMGPAPPPPPMGNAPAPPPPPAMQVVQVGGAQYYLVPNAQGSHTYVPTVPQVAPQWMPQQPQGPHMPVMAPLMAPPGGMFTIPSYRGGMR
jgi:hypothetical protein